jgi:hypothetical protein
MPDPMIHPDTDLQWFGEDVGFGVIATKDIPRGSYTWVRDVLDQVIEPEVAAALRLTRWHLEHDFQRDERGRFILCWDLARYLNHSCEANCLTDPDHNFDIATRDIRAGEQLTNDYGLLGMLPDEVMDCSCGAPSCRGRITGGARPVGLDAKLNDAMRLIPQVAQPLAYLLDLQFAAAPITAARLIKP